VSGPQHRPIEHWQPTAVVIVQEPSGAQHAPFCEQQQDDSTPTAPFLNTGPESHAMSVMLLSNRW